MPHKSHLLGFYCWFAVWVFARTRNEILFKERKTNWVKKLLQSGHKKTTGAQL